MEAGTKVSEAGSVREGSYIVVDGAACRVVSTTISKPGKHGGTKIRIEAVGITDNRKRDIVMPTGENVEVPIIEKRIAQVLNITGNKANVMDTESYETFDLVIPDDMKGQVTEGVTVLYWVVLKDMMMKQIRGAEGQ